MAMLTSTRFRRKVEFGQTIAAQYKLSDTAPGSREETVAKLEELKAGAAVTGLSPTGQAKVVQIEWFGDQAVGLPPLSGPASMREFDAVSCPAVQAGA